jgi:CHAD domain-containing protein
MGLQGSESQTLRDRMATWRELVEQCGRKPTRKRVHVLRVVTLRIQAEVEYEMNQLPRASHEAQAMLHFENVADRLRNALGPVRELDVWIGKLRRLQDSQSGTVDYLPRSSRETIRQIGRIEERLTTKRQKAGLKLVAEIEKRHQNLMMASRDVERATGERRHDLDGEQASSLLNEFAKLVGEFPIFDEENLHDFRKRIKNIRYLAEIHRADPTCGQIASQLRKAQSAIGEWHDWQVLARIASRGKHSKDVEAGELLNSVAAEAYEAAVGVCHNMMRRMADLAQNRHAGSQHMRKAPVRGEDTMGVSAKKLA